MVRFKVVGGVVCASSQALKRGGLAFGAVASPSGWVLNRVGRHERGDGGVVGEPELPVALGKLCLSEVGSALGMVVVAWGALGWSCGWPSYCSPLGKSALGLGLCRGTLAVWTAEGGGSGGAPAGTV